MSQSHGNLIYPLVFSRKDRKPFLTPEYQHFAYRYLAGTVQGLDGIALIVNGTDEHVPLLVKLSGFIVPPASRVPV